MCLSYSNQRNNKSYQGLNNQLIKFAKTTTASHDKIAIKIAQVLELSLAKSFSLQLLYLSYFISSIFNHAFEI